MINVTSSPILAYILIIMMSLRIGFDFLINDFPFYIQLLMLVPIALITGLIVFLVDYFIGYIKKYKNS